MRRVDFYVHSGCLSEKSILSLAVEVLKLDPTWTVTVHQLAEPDIERQGFAVLPAIVINGRTVATGVPNKEWLLRKMGEWTQLNQ
ncbi:MAG: hypothetical protein KF751_19775 [Nitrospira sp.]|nr:hypothetical protein [Nitrospira sp.]